MFWLKVWFWVIRNIQKILYNLKDFTVVLHSVVSLSNEGVGVGTVILRLWTLNTFGLYWMLTRIPFKLYMTAQKIWQRALYGCRSCNLIQDFSGLQCVIIKRILLFCKDSFYYEWFWLCFVCAFQAWRSIAAWVPFPVTTNTRT